MLFVPIFEYHQVLFDYILSTTQIDINNERHSAANQIVFDNIVEYLENLPERVNEEKFILKLQEELEDAIKEIISRKSIYYWLHLYRRIGVEKSFGNESSQTLYYYRNILELAFKKYGKLNLTDELVIISDDSPKQCMEKIANGLFLKALKFFGQAVPNKMTGIFLGDFGEKDLLEIYTLEALAFQYWHTTAALRRLYKGGKIGIIIENNALRYEVFCDKDLEFLMKSYDVRNDKYSELCTTNGIILKTYETTDKLIWVPYYNVYQHSYSEIPQYELFGIVPPESNDIFYHFTPNFIYVPLDLSNYYMAHKHLKKIFYDKNGYKLEEFVSVVYLLFLDYFSFAKRNVFNKFAAQKRAYQYYENKKSLIDSLYKIYSKIKDRINLEIDRTIIGKVIDSLCLPEDRTKMWFSSVGPQYPIFETADSIVIDYNAVSNVLKSKMHFLLKDADHKEDNFKGHYFEDVAVERLRDKGIKLWECKQKLNHSDGSSKEIDLSFIFNNCLFIGEMKCWNMSMDYINGNKKALDYRKNKFEKAIKESNEKVEWLFEHLNGNNFCVPDHINYIVPFVVSPFVEYIWSRDDELWLTESIPRICTLSECELFCDDENIRQMINKPFVIKLKP